MCILHGISRERYGTQLFIEWSGIPTQCSCRVYPRHGAHSTEKYPFQICCKIFLKDIAFMFWHDIMYVELLHCVKQLLHCMTNFEQLLHCVTNFELVWT